MGIDFYHNMPIKVRFSNMTPNEFRSIPAVVKALENPRSPRSVINYICGCNTADEEVIKSLNTDDKVGPLLKIWFASGDALDEFCQPFARVVRELKAKPPTLIGEEWESLEGKVAKVLLADQLSRSCFRGTSEAFSFDEIGKCLVLQLFSEDRLKTARKLPAAILYLLPWALAHSEKVDDLTRAIEIIDISISAYPNFRLFEIRNKKAIAQHRQVLEKFGRYPQRNAQFGRESTPLEKAWLADKDNLPIWAGGKLSVDETIK